MATWNVQRYYLGAGDGPVADSIDLNDVTRHIAQRWRATADGLDVDVLIAGTDADDFARNWDVVEGYAQRASRTSGAYGIGGRIALSLQLTDGSWRYVDLTGGTLVERVTYPGQCLIETTLRLKALPLARGDSYTITPAIAPANVIVAPNDLDQSAWTLTGMTVAAASVTAPDGSLADTLLETAVTSVHRLLQSVTVPSGVTAVTAVAYARADGRSVIEMKVADSSGSNGVNATFNVATGAVVNPAIPYGSGFTGSGATISDAGGGWWRLAMQVVTNGDTTLLVVLDLNNGTSTSYLGDVTKGMAYWNLGLLATVTSATNGIGASFVFPDVPGDVPALARLTLSDVSTNGAVVNGVHAYSRSAVEMTPDGFRHVGKLAAAGNGATTTDTLASNGIAATLATTAEWQTIADLTEPAGTYTRGLLDVWARVQDTYVNVNPPTLSAVIGATTAWYIRQSVTVPNQGLAGTPYVVSWPVEPKAGSLLVVATTHRHAGAAPTTPAGFTLTASKSGTGDGGYLGFIWHRLADGSETSVSITYAAQSASANRAVIALWEIQGAVEVSPVDQTATAGGTGSATAGPTAATVQANELALGIVATDDPGFISFGGTAAKLSVRSFNGADTLSFGMVALATTGTVSASGSPGAAIPVQALVVTFKGRLTAAANLPSSTTVQVAVAGKDATGNVGVASSVLSRATGSTYKALFVDWTAPTTGTQPAEYRVYVNTGSGWSYFDTGSTNPWYLLTTLSGPTGTGAPTFTSSAAGSFWQLRVSLPDGSGGTTTRPVPVEIPGGVWHDLFLGTVTAPPMPDLDGDDPSGWRMTLEVMRDGGGSDSVGADMLWFAPHDETQLIATSPSDLPAKRDWRFDTRREEITTARYYLTGSSTTAGQPTISHAPFLIGPGTALLGVRLTGAAGESDVVNLKVIPELRITSRWLYLKGGG